MSCNQHGGAGQSEASGRRGRTLRSFGNWRGLSTGCDSDPAVHRAAADSVCALPDSVLFIFFWIQEDETSYRGNAAGIAAAIFALCIGPGTPIYGVGNIGAGRQQNIYYYTYLLFLSAECWLVVNCLRSIVREEKWKSIRRCLLLADAGLLAGIAIFTAVKFDFGQTTSGRAAAALQDGSLTAYAAAYDTMLEQLEQAQRSGADVVVNRIPSTSEIFEALQLEEDANGWVNVAMARYYGLGSIRTGNEIAQ